MPPGYKDGRKEDEGIGDFLIWKSLLKFGEEKKLDLAFVTGEEKQTGSFVATGSVCFQGSNE